MELVINHRLRINDRLTTKDGQPVVNLPEQNADPEALYRHLGYSYPKFFKMDILCKWAWLATECLVNYNDALLYNGLDKNKIAVVMATSHGCLEVDKKYKNTLKEIPSPALFVYTLPNIMLGEICIRHGFKGEQICLVSEQFDAEALHFWASDFIEKRGMEACLCGWVDAVNGNKEVALFWISKNSSGIISSPSVLQQLYSEK